MYEIRYSELWDHGYLWPEKDVHLWRHCNKNKFGPKMLDTVIEKASGNKTIVQAGGATGVYAKYYADFFDNVIVFEPDSTNFHCLENNTGSHKNIHINNFALSHNCQEVPMRNVIINAGATHVTRNPKTSKYKAKAVTIDSLNLDSCDVIHLDIEGYETNALRGAMKTIQKYKPLIVLETWDNDLMKSIGYTSYGFAGNDKVFVSYDLLVSR
jgi:FkbM family methyltransferase